MIKLGKKDGIKKAVRERDGYKCQECGMTQEEHKKKHKSGLEVHRITPGSEYSVEPGVCETLCKICHSRKPRSTFDRIPARWPHKVQFGLSLDCMERFKRVSKKLCMKPGSYIRMALVAYMDGEGVPRDEEDCE